MAWKCRGTVNDFDPRLGRGYIRYQGHDIPFDARDVSNYTPERIRTGQRVEFEMERTHRGQRAKDVMVSLGPREAYSYLPSPDEVDYDDELAARSYAQAPEPSIVERNSKAQLFALALFGSQIKLVSLLEDGTYAFIDEHDKLHNLLYVVSSETIQLQSAVEELEHLINSPIARERDFQNFFERYPDFILNDEYREAHPQLVLSPQDGEVLKPDFVLEPIDQYSFCDLLELKLPSAQLFVLKRNRPRFSAAVHEAAAQLREYSKFFEQEQNRKRFESAYPRLKLYKPRMFVIIGRRSTASPLLQREIQSELPNLILRSYDEILLRMKWKIDNPKQKSPPYLMPTVEP